MAAVQARVAPHNWQAFVQTVFRRTVQAGALAAAVMLLAGIGVFWFVHWSRPVSTPSTRTVLNLTQPASGHWTEEEAYSDIGVASRRAWVYGKAVCAGRTPARSTSQGKFVCLPSRCGRYIRPYWTRG
jgi:hypothetical protein